MPTPKQSWSTGGWFGAQLGATAWMLAAAVVALIGSAAAAATCLVTFLLANGVGLVLWRLRDTLSMHRATLIFLGWYWVLSMATLLAIDHLGHWANVARVGGGFTALQAGLMVTGVVTALAGLSWLRGRRETSRS